MWQKSCRWLIVGIVLSIVATGCRPAVRFPVAPVSGRVTFDGVPAARVTVQFNPVGSGEVGPPSVGTADDDGRFTLLLSRQNAGAGAVVGEHVVSIAGLEAYDEIINMIREQAKSPPNGAGDPGQVPTLKMPREEELPTVRIPKRYQGAVLRFTVPKQGTDAANFDLTAK
jgi:hypothetical protein